MASRLLALLVLVLVALPASPARAACAPLALQTFTLGIVDPGAQAPEVCVERRSDDRGAYAWVTITTRSAAQERLVVWRAVPREATPEGIVLDRAYTKPVGTAAPQAFGWHTAPNAVTFEVWEWRNSELVGVAVYAWALPAADSAALPNQVALPLLAR